MSRDRLARDLDPSSPEYDDQLCKNLAGTSYHPGGACKMGATGDHSAVVDPELRLVFRVSYAMYMFMSKFCIIDLIIIHNFFLN